LFAGTPPWQVDFLKKFINIHAVKFGDKFPDFKLFIHSGCSFAPYRQQVFDLIGDRPNYYTMEMFPASEGFIAFQDQWDDDKKTVKDMLLNVNSNIFFEFLPIEENNSYSYDNRLTVKDVELNKSYALVVSVLGGFLSYHIGDNITVTHLNPIRIRFSGRSRFNINLIGEHMDYETILNIFINLKKNFNLDDFSLLPKLCKKEQGKIYYHWYFTSSDEKLHTSKIEEEIHKLCIENNAFFKSIAQSGYIEEHIIL